MKPSSSLYNTGLENPTEKQLKKFIRKLHYPEPDQKQFVAYSLALKESNSGISSHQRLFLFDSKEKSLRYYSKIPEPLPSVDALPDGKEVVFIKKTKKFTFRSARTNIGKANVSWSEIDGSKKEWVISFGSNPILNEWVLMVNEVMKDGHHRPENRPASIIKKTLAIDPSKYQTQFMKETTNQNETRSREESLMKKPFWEKDKEKEKDLKLENKSDPKWLSKHLMAKEQMIRNEHQNLIAKEEELIRRERQLLLKKEEEIDRKMKEIEQKEKEQTQPAIKPEQKKRTHEQKIVQQSRSAQEKGKLPEPKFIIENDTVAQESPIKEKDTINTSTKKKIHQQEQIETEYRKRLKSVAQSYTPKYIQQEHQWVHDKEPYLNRYDKFLKQCQLNTQLIVDNLPTLLSEASTQNSYSKAMYFKGEDLHIEKYGIHYTIELVREEGAWCASWLRMEAVSKNHNFVIMAERTHRVELNVLPVACIEYKGYRVWCKSTVPQFYKPLQNQQLALQLSLPSDWKVYTFNDSILVDYDSMDKPSATNFNPVLVEEIINDIESGQVHIGCIDDLNNELLLRCGSPATEHVIIQLSKQSNSHYQCVFNHFLYGVMVGVEMLHDIRKNSRTMGNGEVVQRLYYSMRLYINPQSTEYRELWQCVHKLTSYHLGRFQPCLVLTTIMNVIGLEVVQNNFSSLNNVELKHPNLAIKFTPSLLYVFPHVYDGNYLQLRNILLQQPEPERHEELAFILEQVQPFSSLNHIYKEKYLNYKHIFTPYAPQKDETIHELVTHQPPTSVRTKLAINCVKWLMKSNRHALVESMLRQQMEICEYWLGQWNSLCIELYDLATMYYLSRYDYSRAILYGKKAFENCVLVHGQESEQVIEKLYQLGNIYLEAEMLLEALDTYREALHVLEEKSGEVRAEVMIRKKVSMLLLTMGNTDECLEELLFCLKTEQEPEEELWILGQMIKCYQILKKSQKLMQMVEIMSNRFNAEESNELRRQYLEICLYPYIREKIPQQSRRELLCQLTQAIEQKYGQRYQQEECHRYLLKFGSKFNIIQQMIRSLRTVAMPSQAALGEIEYTLYDHKLAHQETTKVLIQTMRLLEVLGGVVGYEYIRGCFCDYY